MKKLVISLALALLLVAAIITPVMAANEQSVGASVSVSEVISITLTDAGTAGINFGSVAPNTEDTGDTDQADGTPAIQVAIASETNTNVDIGIKGQATGALALAEWEYSLTYVGTKISLTDSYVAEYTNKAASETCDFYHWVDVPTNTPSGAQTCTVSYKAVETGTSF